MFEPEKLESNVQPMELKVNFESVDPDSIDVEPLETFQLLEPETGKPVKAGKLVKRTGPEPPPLPSTVQDEPGSIAEGLFYLVLHGLKLILQVSVLCILFMVFVCVGLFGFFTVMFGAMSRVDGRTKHINH